MRTVTIRQACGEDAGSLLAIYRPFIETSATSFETVVPTVEEFGGRIRKAVAQWQWLVSVQDGELAGYAYASSHRERAAYQWSVETSAYVHPDYLRRGIGRALYEQLFQDLSEKGFCNAFAGIALPNDASIALHEKLGFAEIGTFRNVGRKFGSWQHVRWFQKAIRDEPIGASRP